MIASLGMYDHPAFQGAVDRFWALIRDGLRDSGLSAPDQLCRGKGAYWAAWESPDLILSQTCGLPYRAKLHDKVALIGTPDYGVDGCPPGLYRSVFLVRRGDKRSTIDALSDARFAFNEALSQSGWAAPLAHFQRRGLILRPVVQTGSHRSSINTILAGDADFAAVDAVTWAFLQEHEAATQDLRVVDVTEPTPGLPLIAAKDRDIGKTRRAVADAVAALTDADRTSLRLRGVVDIAKNAYLAQPIPAPPDQFAQSF